MRLLTILIVATCFTASSWAQDLSIWKDPEFQRRFNEGLLAVSDVEPPISEQEIEAMQEVLQLMADEDIDRAISVLGNLIGKENSAVYDFTLGHLLFQKDRFDQAAIAFGSAVKKFPKYRRAWNYLGQTYVRIGKFREAVPALTRTLEFGESRGTTYGLLGYAHSNVGNYIAAETAYRMAVLLDPETPDWQMGLARAFYKQQRYLELASFCESMLQADPSRTDLWMLQANAFIGLGRPMDAAKNFEMLDGLGKSTAASLNGLGDIYINEGLFDLGVQAYLRALPMGGPGAEERPLAAARNLVVNGGLEETQTLLDGMEQHFGEAMAQDTQKEILILRSRLALARGGGEEEAKVLEQVVALDPLDGEALILLGHYYRRAGEAEVAMNYFDRAEKITGFEAKALVGKAQLLVGQGKYREALPLLRRAQQVDPQDYVQDFLDQVERGAKAS